MNKEQIDRHFGLIRRLLTTVREDSAFDWIAMDTSLEDLQVAYEQLQTNLEVVKAIEAEQFQRKQHYKNMFQFFPIAALVTNINGLILEANEAIAQWLNVSPNDLVGQPLAALITPGDRATMRTHLDALSQSTGSHIWRMCLSPRQGKPILAEFHGSTIPNLDGQIEHLAIGVYNLSHAQDSITGEVSNILAARRSQQQRLEVTQVGQSMTPLHPQLDGLRVLVVDDEVDVCEFVTAILEAHGIQVKTVTSAATALAELNQFRPDVLLSDIRMPNDDGYRLIQQVRALEAAQGGHIPAAAMTAYLDEDWEKARSAGFETHLYKLAQPREWVEMVVQLANQSSHPDQDL